LLCEKGLAIDGRNLAGDRPLCIAAYHGHTEVVERLLNFKAPLRLPFGDRSCEDSPLFVIAKEGHLGVISVLLKSGASAQQKDEFGWSPIRYAAAHGYPEVLELLLTQASTLSDDFAGASTFDNTGEYVGFAAVSGMSEERKARIRELLFQAEDQADVYMVERTVPSIEPGSQTSADHRLQNLTSVSWAELKQLQAIHKKQASPQQTMGYITAGLHPLHVHQTPKPRDIKHPRHKSSTTPQSALSCRGEALPKRLAICVSPPHHQRYTTNLRRLIQLTTSPWRQSVSAQMSLIPSLLPEEAARLID
jgi:hypothetical protein